MNSTDKDSAINFLTGPAYDSRTHTPAYKQTKVRMEVLGSCDTPPLPKTNPRNKNVIRKTVWKLSENGTVRAMCT